MVVGHLPMKAQVSKVSSAKSRSLLWKITGNQMKQPSYLFGTMHMICADDYLWTAAMKRSLSATREVCFEMDMDDPMVMMQVAQGMVNISGKALHEYFSPEDYQVVVNHFSKKLQVDTSMLARLKPSALMMMMATEGVTCAHTVSYENNIMEAAKELKMDITGLETPQEQLALLESIPADTIAGEIARSIKEKGEGSSNEYQALVQAYKQQDLATLFTLMTQNSKSSLNLNTFIDERNAKWIERMEERMDQQAVFFAVGAGHLWGEKGVIQLLRDKGYTVVPVK